MDRWELTIFDNVNSSASEKYNFPSSFLCEYLIFYCMSELLYVWAAIIGSDINWGATTTT